MCNDTFMNVLLIVNHVYISMRLVRKGMRLVRKGMVSIEKTNKMFPIILDLV